MDIKTARDFYINFAFMEELNLKKMKTFEERADELGLVDYKPLDYKERRKINKKFIQEIGFNEEKTSSIIGLIGDKGFLALSTNFILKSQAVKDKVLNKLAYKVECLDIIDHIRSMYNLDLTSLSILTKSIKELISKENMNITSNKLIYKEYESDYTFTRGGLWEEFNEEDSHDIYTMEDHLEAHSNVTYADVDFYLPDLCEAQIINPKLIKLDGVGELHLEYSLPKTNLKYKVYPNKFHIEMFLDNHVKNKNICHNMYSYLVFLEGQDRLFK